MNNGCEEMWLENFEVINSNANHAGDLEELYEEPRTKVDEPIPFISKEYLRIGHLVTRFDYPNPKVKSGTASLYH